MPLAGKTRWAVVKGPRQLRLTVNVTVTAVGVQVGVW